MPAMPSQLLYLHTLKLTPMRLSFLLASLCFSSFASAQNITEQNSLEHAKCNHATIASRTDQASYYQYPSMDKYDVHYLKLNLNIEAGSSFISGTALTSASVLQPLDSFNIELADNMTLDSVYINGVRKSFSRGVNYVFVPITPALPAGSTVSALFFYSGTAGYGVYSGTSASSGLIYSASLSESYQARAWFPAKQILKDKIDSADIWIKTSNPNLAGANGVLVAVVDSPGNKKQYQWKSRHPMSYYMPSFSVGNYAPYVNWAKPAAMAPDSIEVLHYIVDDDTYFNTVQANLDKTPAFIETFSNLFGLYPFYDEKYGHCQANIGGGMEHQTMSTMSSFGSNVIAHELGHQWWGDHVTCATWNHIWLNEGFASYCEYLAVEKLPALFPGTTAFNYMNSFHNSVMSQTGGSVFVPDASIFDENRIFSGRLSYNKGAAIIHNLRFEMQDDNVFFQALKNFQVQYKDSVATADDFKAVAEATSGKNFTDFFNQWYYGEGYPTFNMVFTMQGTDSIILQVNQTVSMPDVTPFFKGLYEFTITSAQGDTTVKAYITHDGQQVKFKYNKIPNGIIVDPNNWVINKVGSIINGGTILPVNLTAFNVNNIDCNAVVSWKASGEQQTKQYELEYSNNGTDYKTIATINSNHNISESSYQFNYTPGPASIHYFRLKIVGDNNSYVYSQVVTSTKSCNSAFAVQVTPNPASDNVTAIITVPQAGNTNIQIFDHKGSLVYRESKMLNEGENKIQLGVFKSLPKAVYIIKVENNNTVITSRLVKQ